MNTSFSELLQTCRGTHVAVLQPMIDVVHLAFSHVLPLFACNVPPDDPLRRSAEMTVVQMHCSHLMLQLRVVNSEGDIGRLPTRQEDDDSTKLRTLLDTSSDENRLIDGQIASLQKEKEAAAFQQFVSGAKLGHH